jgi:hypothetical protein
VDEQPFFYCLLEDDAQITRVTVETDYLHDPVTTSTESHVVVLLHVAWKAKPGWSM